MFILLCCKSLPVTREQLHGLHQCQISYWQHLKNNKKIWFVRKEVKLITLTTAKHNTAFITGSEKFFFPFFFLMTNKHFLISLNLKLLPLLQNKTTSEKWICATAKKILQLIIQTIASCTVITCEDKHTLKSPYWITCVSDSTQCHAPLWFLYANRIMEEWFYRVARLQRNRSKQCK